MGLYHHKRENEELKLEIEKLKMYLEKSNNENRIISKENFDLKFSKKKLEKEKISLEYSQKFMEECNIFLNKINYKIESDIKTAYKKSIEKKIQENSDFDNFFLKDKFRAKNRKN